jgi:hypothetical protein
MSMIMMISINLKSNPKGKQPKINKALQQIYIGFKQGQVLTLMNFLEEIALQKKIILSAA